MTLLAFFLIVYDLEHLLENARKRSVRADLTPSGQLTLGSVSGSGLGQGNRFLILVVLNRRFKLKRMKQMKQAV